MTSGMTIFTSVRYDPALLHGIGHDPANDPPSYAGFKGLPAHAGFNATTPSALYMLDLHRDRLLNAATHFHFAPAAKLLSGPEGVELLSSQILHGLKTTLHSTSLRCPRRAHVSIDEHGHIFVGSSPTPGRAMRNLFPVRLPPPGSVGTDSAPDEPARVEDDAWIIVVDATTRVEPSEYTHYKTSRRDIYDHARSHAGISSADRMEVVLVDTDGNVNIARAQDHIALYQSSLPSSRPRLD
jgi:4-amino-4-deoxychorismate lyase